MNANTVERLLRLPQVLELIPVAKSTIWKWIQEGRFPAPTKLGERVSVWPESSVRAFITSQTEGQGGDAHV